MLTWVIFRKASNDNPGAERYHTGSTPETRSAYFWTIKNVKLTCKFANGVSIVFIHLAQHDHVKLVVQQHVVDHVLAVELLEDGESVLVLLVGDGDLAHEGAEEGRLWRHFCGLLQGLQAVSKFVREYAENI